ncbi:MAG: hypothetical protein KGJ79_11615 [Alphaproteobacteria bacterium]|nr:hypothetical protein [Alphaproteobacteria bacterium]MDE2495445.1 hypothetical protein [Alphaproteobacteria bacterium]
MTNRNRRKSTAAKSVFINCPFDDDFKPIFRAIVFTIIASGYYPRCALDATDGAEIRVSKIADMIGECDWGIHDISRVEFEPGELPRFNMPLELGLHLGARLLGEGRHRRKRALILEAKQHRYDEMLSDISGQDIEVHGNRVGQAIAKVRNWLSEHRAATQPPLPGARALQGDYERFKREVAAILRRHRLDALSKITHNDFLFAVRDWIESQGNPQAQR